MKRKLVFFAIFIIILVLGGYYFFIAKAPEIQADQITWGVNFSKEYATFLGVDWKEAYTATLEDLQVKNIKLLNQWDEIEINQGQFSFDDVDWQLDQAQNHDAKIIYVVGMKSGRWPECHVPDWAANLSKADQQKALLDYIKEVIVRYKDRPNIVAWQAKNEPLYHFGVCPWYDENFLKQEVALIKSIDPSRPVIVSDSGEQSLWLQAAQIGDIVGTTMYRKVWFHITNTVGFYINLPLPAVSYFDKAALIKKLFGKKVINVELQAEPWVPDVSDASLLNQQATMNVAQFDENITYAKQSGFDTFYLWGTEWWYWMKTKQNQPDIWNEAKKLFQSSTQ